MLGEGGVDTAGRRVDELGESCYAECGHTSMPDDNISQMDRRHSTWRRVNGV